MDNHSFEQYLSNLKDRAGPDRAGVMEEISKQISTRSSEWKKYSKIQFNQLRGLRGFLEFGPHEDEPRMLTRSMNRKLPVGVSVLESPAQPRDAVPCRVAAPHRAAAPRRLARRRQLWLARARRLGPRHGRGGHQRTRRSLPPLDAQEEQGVPGEDAAALSFKG